MSQFQQAKVGRRIVCSAVRAEDGSVLIGIRHYSADMHEQIAARADGEKFRHRPDCDQGFVDQHGVFLNRAEAYQVASPDHLTVKVGMFLRRGLLVTGQPCGSADRGLRGQPNSLLQWGRKPRLHCKL